MGGEEEGDERGPSGKVGEQEGEPEGEKGQRAQLDPPPLPMRAPQPSRVRIEQKQPALDIQIETGEGHYGVV